MVEQYARAYLWYILTEVVFPNYSGNSALWMYLDFLKDWDAGYSWRGRRTRLPIPFGK